MALLLLPRSKSKVKCRLLVQLQLLLRSTTMRSHMGTSRTRSSRPLGPRRYLGNLNSLVLKPRVSSVVTLSPETRVRAREREKGRRQNGARDTVASAGRRNVRERGGGRFVRMGVRIAANWIVRGGIAGGRTRSAMRGGWGCNSGRKCAMQLGLGAFLKFLSLSRRHSLFFRRSILRHFSVWRTFPECASVYFVAIHFVSECRH